MNNHRKSETRKSLPQFKGRRSAIISKEQMEQGVTFLNQVQNKKSPQEEQAEKEFYEEYEDDDLFRDLVLANDDFNEESSSDERSNQKSQEEQKNHELSPPVETIYQMSLADEQNDIISHAQDKMHKQIQPHQIIDKERQEKLQKIHKHLEQSKQIKNYQKLAVEKERAKKERQDQKLKDEERQKALNEAKSIWIYGHKELCWAIGHKIKEQNNQLILKCQEDNQIFKIDNDKPMIVHPSSQKGLNNLENLREMTEGSILHTLRLRFSKNKFMTRLGKKILIYVNPYKPLNIFTTKKALEYYNQSQSIDQDKNRPKNDVKELDPHLFEITQDSYNEMRQSKKNQIIILTGESGSGKTEAAKLSLSYLLQANNNFKEPYQDLYKTKKAQHQETFCNQKDLTIEIIVNGSNSLFEFFGNAKTLKNNNSSRFAKLTKIYFRKMKKLRSAQISIYLFEQIRVVKQAANERNFHIFYQVLAAKYSDHDFLRNYELEDAHFYNYTKYGSCKNIEGVNDTDNFQILLNCMNNVGIERNQMRGIIDQIVAILNLGNVEFTISDTYNHTVKPTKNSIYFLVTCADLLQVDFQKLRDSLTGENINIQNSSLSCAKKIDHCCQSRDQAAQQIYAQLFSWILQQVNLLLQNQTSQEIFDSNKEKAKLNFIGMLDITGFEVQDTNSIEQIFINTTNECIQRIFNMHMFSSEQEQYDKENINWQHINFTNNQITIDLFRDQNKPSIFSLLDDVCIQNGNDEDFIKRCKVYLTNNSLFSINQTSKKKITELLEYRCKGKISNPLKNRNTFPSSGKQLQVPNQFVPGQIQDSQITQFSIQHYASKVTYSFLQIVQKIANYQNIQLIKCLANSKNSIVRQNFEQLLDKYLTNDKSKQMIWKNFTLNKFETELQEIESIINSSSSRYIRCIKPNSIYSPTKFDSWDVLYQTRCSGVLESIRIRKAGYGIRMKFQDFITKYNPICKAFPKSTTSVRLSFKINSQKAVPKLKQSNDKLENQILKSPPQTINPKVQQTPQWYQFNSFSETQDSNSQNDQQQQSENNYLTSILSYFKQDQQESIEIDSKFNDMQKKVDEIKLVQKHQYHDVQIFKSKQELNKNKKYMCIMILEKYEESKLEQEQSWQVGQTMVFLKEETQDGLETILNSAYENLYQGKEAIQQVIKIQRFFKKILAKKLAQRLTQAYLTINKQVYNIQRGKKLRNVIVQAHSIMKLYFKQQKIRKAKKQQRQACIMIACHKKFNHLFQKTIQPLLNQDEQVRQKDQQQLYFEPNFQGALIIYNTNYNEVRGCDFSHIKDPDERRKLEKPYKDAGFCPGYQDVQSASEDARVIREFLLNVIGMQESNLIMISDASKEQIDDALLKLKELFKMANKSKTMKPFIWVYYSGHGVMNNYSCIVLNKRMIKQRYYHLEYRCENLTKYNRNTCIFVSFDCCREQISLQALHQQEDPLDILASKIPTETRGSEIQKIGTQMHKKKIFCLFGCPPNQGVLLKSNMAESLVQVFTDSILSNRGVLNFKKAISNIQDYLPNSKINSDPNNELILIETNQWFKPQQTLSFENFTVKNPTWDDILFVKDTKIEFCIQQREQLHQIQHENPNKIYLKKVQSKPCYFEFFHELIQSNYNEQSSSDQPDQDTQTTRKPSIFDKLFSNSQIKRRDTIKSQVVPKLTHINSGKNPQNASNLRLALNNYQFLEDSSEDSSSDEQTPKVKRRQSLHFDQKQSTFTGFVDDQDRKQMFGEFRFLNGEVYKGQFKDDKITGFGVKTLNDGKKLKGQFLDGKFLD